MFTDRFKLLWVALGVSLALIMLTLINFPVSQALKQMSLFNQRQGISGVVTRLQGNQMPTVNTSKPRTAPSPVATQVWIFSGRIPGHGTDWPIREAQAHPNLIRRVQSDEQGKFFVSLPPGEYTLFAQYGDRLYLNSFLGDGSYASTQVSEGNVTEVRLVNAEDAAF